MLCLPNPGLCTPWEWIRDTIWREITKCQVYLESSWVILPRPISRLQRAFDQIIWCVLSFSLKWYGLFVSRCRCSDIHRACILLDLSNYVNDSYYEFHIQQERGFRVEGKDVAIIPQWCSNWLYEGGTEAKLYMLFSGFCTRNAEYLRPLAGVKKVSPAGCLVNIVIF